MRRRRGEISRHIDPTTGKRDLLSQSLPQEVKANRTRVMEYDTPDASTFDLTALGSDGRSPISHADAWNAQMDPMSWGADVEPHVAMERSAFDMARGWEKTYAHSQVDTKLLESEAVTQVVRFEQTSDDQISSVGGVDIKGDPDNVDQTLRLAASMPQQMQAPDLTHARRALTMSRTAMQSPQHREAFKDALADMGWDAHTSLPATEQPGRRDDVEVVNEIGLPMTLADFSDPDGRMLMDVARQQSQRQDFGAARPAARFHPAQSDYRSSDGQVTTAQLPALGRVVAPLVKYPMFTVGEQRSASVMRRALGALPFPTLAVKESNPAVDPSKMLDAGYWKQKAGIQTETVDKDGLVEKQKAQQPQIPLVNGAQKQRNTSRGMVAIGVLAVIGIAGIALALSGGKAA